MHGLRHGHARLLRKNDVDLAAISDRLGHSNLAITKAYYLDKDEGLDRKAADVMGTLLGKGDPTKEPEPWVMSLKGKK